MILLRLRDRYGEFNIYKINKIIIFISFILFIISLYFVKNVYLLIGIYLLLLYISRYFDKNLIKLICSLLAIILFGFLLISFVKFNIVKKETFIIFEIIIKGLFFLDYSIVIYYLYKYYQKDNTKINNNYTFKELRKNNYERFKLQTINDIKYYLKNKNILKKSDEYKLIENNIENKSKEELEKYVWLNYLRFYKNQKYKKNNQLSLYDFVFLIIHVIILLLILFVR